MKPPKPPASTKTKPIPAHIPEEFAAFLNSYKQEPILTCDTREQEPLTFPNYQCERVTITTGDYSIRGFDRFFQIERKSIADAVGCLAFDPERERVLREMQRMGAATFRRFVVVGTEKQMESHIAAIAKRGAKATLPRILATLDVIDVQYGVPVVWIPTPELAALQIERWARHFVRQQWGKLLEFSRLATNFSTPTP